jgi:hypothetical protein
MTKTREQLLAEREAEIAEVAAKYDAQIAAMDAEFPLTLDMVRDAIRPHIGGDDYFIDYKPIVVALKAALPLAPRAVMGEAEIEALAWKHLEPSGFSPDGPAFECCVAALKEALSRAPVAAWPGEREMWKRNFADEAPGPDLRDLLWQCQQLLEQNVHTKSRDDLAERRLIMAIRAHMTGEQP